MTDLLYQSDSYLREFDAVVVDVQDQNVILDRTAFYPRGGGQPADRGFVSSGTGRWEVVAVEKRGGDVMHTVEGKPPAVGTSVHGVVDWDFRYQMMRTHSALHVLCGVIFQQYGALVTGNQMYPDRARMDFTLADLTPERIREIENLSNQAIAAGYPVRVRFISRAEAETIPDLIRTKVNLVPPEVDPIRTVEIVGLDHQADGGTHVSNTLEIGGLRVTKTENKGKQNRRLEIQLFPLEGQVQ
ncbi:MAG TPA: alanyl-tRNA editing protein AlaXM [Chloroflexota bacterium]|nr:alanyl-tRNA editing protein AlaXM [Chloroflexota bacterium]